MRSEEHIMIEPRTAQVGSAQASTRVAGPEPVAAELSSPAPSAPPSPVRGIVWELIDVDAYAVTCDADTVGFVDVVGSVYVALAGPDYHRAVEIAQATDLESAIATIVVARS